MAGLKLLWKMEGPKAPHGKIAQQRQRRFRTAMERTGKIVFDSNAISLVGSVELNTLNTASPNSS